jgi:hypothetical protein
MTVAGDLESLPVTGLADHPRCPCDLAMLLVVGACSVFRPCRPDFISSLGHCFA